MHILKYYVLDTLTVKESLPPNITGTSTMSVCSFSETHEHNVCLFIQRDTQVLVDHVTSQSKHLSRLVY